MTKEELVELLLKEFCFTNGFGEKTIMLHDLKLGNASIILDGLNTKGFISNRNQKAKHIENSLQETEKYIFNDLQVSAGSIFNREQKAIKICNDKQESQEIHNRKQTAQKIKT